MAACSISLGALATGIGGLLHGGAEIRVGAIAALDKAGEGDLSFLSNRKYRRQLAATRASAVILRESDLDACPVPAVVCEDPYLGYALAARMLYPASPVTGGIHSSAVVDPSAQVHPSAWIGQNAVVESGSRIGERVFIGPGSVVECDCRIGDDSRIGSNVSLLRGSQVGRRVVIHAGAVVGGDGFGFARTAQGWLRIPQVGRVIIGDDVEIGVNTAVDRGALGDTVIDKGAILDNLIQIGHNVLIGERTAIVACTGVSGSTRIGADCILGGQVGVAGHLVIADGVFLAAGSNVSHDLAPGRYGGMLPVDPDPQWRRNVSRLRRLDELWKRVGRIERKLSGSGHKGNGS